MRSNISEEEQTEEYIKKVEIYCKQREYYIPRGIRKVKGLVPEERIATYMDQFSFDWAIRRASTYFKYCGIREDSKDYASCISDAGLMYMYAVYRCAYCGYEHFWGYFYLMLHIVIIWNYYLNDDAKVICITNSLKRLNLDADNVNL